MLVDAKFENREVVYEVDAPLFPNMLDEAVSVVEAGFFSVSVLVFSAPVNVAGLPKLRPVVYAGVAAFEVVAAVEKLSPDGYAA